MFLAEENEQKGSPQVGCWGNCNWVLLFLEKMVNLLDISAAKSASNKYSMQTHQIL